jgi:hypothetical protein
VKPKRKRTTLKDYLNEIVEYGGELVTRGEMIKDLESKATSIHHINAYLAGFDRRAGEPNSAPATVTGADGKEYHAKIIM